MNPVAIYFKEESNARSYYLEFSFNNLNFYYILMLVKLKLFRYLQCGICISQNLDKSIYFQIKYKCIVKHFKSLLLIIAFQIFDLVGT